MKWNDFSNSRKLRTDSIKSKSSLRTSPNYNNVRRMTRVKSYMCLANQQREIKSLNEGSSLVLLRMLHFQLISRGVVPTRSLFRDNYEKLRNNYESSTITILRLRRYYAILTVDKQYYTWLLRYKIHTRLDHYNHIPSGASTRPHDNHYTALFLFVSNIQLFINNF